MGRGRNLGNGKNVWNIAPPSASLTSAISPVLESPSPAPSLSWEWESESESSGNTSLPWDVSVSGAMANIANPPFMDGPLPLRSLNSNVPKISNPEGDHFNNPLPHCQPYPFPPRYRASYLTVCRPRPRLLLITGDSRVVFFRGLKGHAPQKRGLIPARPKVCRTLQMTPLSHSSVITLST